MTIEVRVADDERSREALYRFRYAIYVEEMSRTQHWADHTRKRIEDPLDSRACNLVAWSESEVVGCVRNNLSRDGGLEFYQDLLGMSDVPAGDFPAHTSLCTRLMIRSDFRNSTALVRLFLENYRYGLSVGVRWTFLDCNDHLVQLFERFGFVATHRTLHPEYGEVNAMRLDLLDARRLHDCGSPFARVLDEHLAMAGS